MGHVKGEAESLFGRQQRNPVTQVGNIAQLQQQFAKQIMAGQVPAGFTTPINNQFNVAQQQAMDLLPRGGQLNSALLNLNTQRAQAIGGLPAQLLPLALGQLGQAQNAYGGLASNQAQKKTGTGQALGKLGAAAMLGGGSPALAAGGAGAAFPAAGLSLGASPLIFGAGL